MHKDQKYQYSFSDIEKYLNGALSPAAMHELEKAALQDPFLADALEGYQQADMNRTKKHLSEIAQEVTGKEEKGRVIAFRPYRFGWLRAAVILVLFAGISTITFILLNKPDTTKPQLADTKQNDSVVLPVPPFDTAAMLAITKAEKNKDLPAATAPLPMMAATAPETKLAATEAEMIHKESANPLTAIITQSNTVKPLLADSLNNLKTLLSSAATPANLYSYEQSLQGKVAGVQVTYPKNNYLIKGLVLDSRQKPLPHASVQVNTPAARNIVITDTNGGFQISSKDSTASVTVNAIGYESVQSNLTASAANLVMMNNDSASLNEVVVTGYARQRKKDMTGTVAKKVQSAQSRSSIQPAGGMKALIDTIRLKWQAEQWEPKLLQGNITCLLSFTTTGHIKTVSFSGSPNRQLKKKLTILLKEGPVWLDNNTPAQGKHFIILAF